MKTMNENKFLQLYQTIKFQENISDFFSIASAKRKTMIINYHGSLHLNKDNRVTEFFVNEDLREYGKIIDSKETNSVNNYAGHVLALLSNYQNDDKKYWASHLNEFSVIDHFESSLCSNSFNCRNSEFSSEYVNQTKNILIKPEEIEKFNTEDLNTLAKPEIRQITEDRTNTKQLFFHENNFPKNTNKFKEKEETPKPTPNLFIPKEKYSFQKNVSKLSQEEEKGPSKTKDNFYFRTAKDELLIQNAKKFKKNDYGNSDTRSSGNETGKKFLGTRKGGVFSKFQPPIRTDENKEQEQMTGMDKNPEIDERLKNIDQNMIELIKNEIMDCGSKITWSDIAGLHLAKTTIQEIVVWPMLRPDIFTGLRRPPKGILLFGPPGTGKTLIGKCIASQSNSTFFSISASSLTSKWVGDGEKMVRTLFAVARVYQPSVVFIDEIDSLLSQRSDSEHECSRRIKTEFLVQLDGAGTSEEDRILIIGATNRPQELDEAARRRLVKRLYIPLPDEEARKQIIENLLSTEKHSLTESDIKKIAKLTKGYSGADVKNLCQEASLGPVRSIPPTMIQSINFEEVRPLNAGDFESALCRIKSSVSEGDLEIYLAWDKQYGCGSASNP